MKNIPIKHLYLNYGEESWYDPVEESYHREDGPQFINWQIGQINVTYDTLWFMYGKEYYE